MLQSFLRAQFTLPHLQHAGENRVQLCMQSIVQVNATSLMPSKEKNRSTNGSSCYGDFTCKVQNGMGRKNNKNIEINLVVVEFFLLS